VSNLPKTYKDLLFWKSSFETSKLIIRLSKKLPRTVEVKVVLGQLLRSASSVGANIAEGYGRFGTKEYSRFLQISLGSANETEYWLLILKECVPGLSKEIDMIIEKNIESIKMLASSLKSIRNRG